MLVSLHNFALKMVKHLKNWSHIKFLWTFSNFPHQLIPILGTPVISIYFYPLYGSIYKKNCNRTSIFWVRHFGKINQFWFDDFLVKKVTKSQKLCFDKNTFCSVFPVLIDLQTCTLPHFKENFIRNDLSLYHGWATVASGATRDENVSLLTFGTPSTPISLL